MRLSWTDSSAARSSRADALGLPRQLGARGGSRGPSPVSVGYARIFDVRHYKSSILQVFTGLMGSSGRPSRR